MSNNNYQIQEINTIENLNYSNNLEPCNYINNNIKNNPSDDGLNNLITSTPSMQKETIIKFNINDIEKENIKINSRNFNISPLIRRTPNTKTDIIIQKIYSNRKNVIKNYQSTSTKNFETNNPSFTGHKMTSFTPSTINKKLQTDNILYNYESDNTVNYLNCINNTQTYKTNDIINDIVNDKKDTIMLKNSILNDTSLTQNSTRIKDQCSSSDSSPISDSVNENSMISISDNSIKDLTYRSNDKRKRKYYRTIKLKKNNVQPLNMNEMQRNDIYQTTPKTTPLSSPRDITQDLWNDLVENYYTEFQKLCKEEAEKYKYLSHRNELISNLLKFILLVSGCFTFTLSISIPTSLFMSTTTTISSCLTTIITSVTAFFQFDKKSEIQYNIYRELDKLYNTISLEMLKPTYIRADPYEYILFLRNRRDELLKTLQKK